MIRRGAIAVAAIAVVGVVAGCDSGPPPPAAPVFGDVSAAWQSQPFRVPDGVVASAIVGCRGGGIPADVRPVLADARGSDRITIIFESVDRTTSGTCAAVRSSDGSWQAGSSSLNSGTLAPPPPGRNAVELGLESEGGGAVNGLTAQGRSTASGHVGANVAGVQLVVAGRPIMATVGGGWFSAWWPSGDDVSQVTALGADGQPLPQTPTVP